MRSRFDTRLGWPFSGGLWTGLTAGLIVLAALAALDAVTGESAVLVALYALAPFVAAILGGRRATVAVAIAAFMAGILSWAWNPDSGFAERAIRLAVIFAGSLLALFAARARAQARRALQRLGILNEIAAVASRALSLDETLEAVEAEIVPAFADFCIIDRVRRDRGGRAAIERYSVAVDGPRAGELRDRLAARPPSVPRELIDGVAEGEEPAGDAVRLVADVDEETLRGLAHGEEDLAFLRGFGLNSYIHVALRSRGEGLGVVTLGVAWSGRRYDEEDAAFAAVLGGRIALALDNAGLFLTLESTERRLDTAMAVLDEAVAIVDPEGRLAFANPAAARLFGVSDPADMIGHLVEDARRWCRFYDEEGGSIPHESLDELRERLADTDERPIVRVVFESDGREVWLRPRVRTVSEDGAGSQFTVTALEDLTEIKRQEFDQTLLGRAGEVLSRTDGYEEMLRRLAELTVPVLCDCCAVDLVRSDGTGYRVAFCHRDGEAADRRLLEQGSAMTLDLIVGGERAGTVSFANERGRRPLSEEDRCLAGKLLERAGAALEKARLAAERAEIATGLQQGLIPPPLPEIPSWDVAALFRPAGEETEVGGDFYEAFRIKGGWMAVIGDVTGRGPRAASVTAQARYTLRTAGILSRDPRAALAALNRALLAREGSPLCSAIVMVLHEGEERADVVVAGHPPPLVCGGGGVREVGPAGPVLGAFDDAEWPVAAASIRPGEQLVLHTDGVTEISGEGGRFGEARLREILGAESPPADLLAGLEGALEEFSAGRLRDDVAVLTMAPEREPDPASGPDIDVVRAFHQAFDRRAVEQMAEACAPDVELHPPGLVLGGEARTYRGPEGVRSYVADLEELWEDLILTPRRFSQVGDTVVVRGRVYARGRPLGIRDVPMSWAWTVRDGKLVRCETFSGSEEARGFAESMRG